MRISEASRKKAICFYIIILISSIMLCICVKQPIETLAVKLIGEQELTLKMTDTSNNNNKSIQILCEGSEYELF